MITLRPYQSDAVEAILGWVKTSLEPCVSELATGAGKSLIIAEVAKILHELSGKRILCLAPSSELVTQNHEKYLLTGNGASIYSASAGTKCLRRSVVFATPGTFNSVAERIGSQFCAVIIDEAHGMTPTIKTIISDMRKSSPNLRVIMLTATPYRLGEGFIYRLDLAGNPVEACKDPYGMRLVYRITCQELIGMGYLTPPVVGAPLADNYETTGLQLNKRNQFDAGQIDRAFVGHGRKTAAIVADVVNQAENKNGVMLFASTVQHAQEIMASLPVSLSACVVGDTRKQERKSIISRFKAGHIKYLVSVGTLHTGFDAPNVDVIALLRLTESVGLLQQIIGRGTRLLDGKTNFLVLDYAGNFERHSPDGDIFNPIIRVAKGGGSEKETVSACCPTCNADNEFSARPNEGFKISADGYFTDNDGLLIETEYGPMPAHFGRRCKNFISSPVTKGLLVQCSYRWTSKDCPHCEEPNDIAARYCSACRGEIVDPNKKLKMEFRALKKDPSKIQTDEVVSWTVAHSVSKKGAAMVRVDYVTPYRKFSIYYFKESKWPNQIAQYEELMTVTTELIEPPKTITYHKDSKDGFFRVHGYNEPHDVEPEEKI